MRKPTGAGLPSGKQRPKQGKEQIAQNAAQRVEDHIVHIHAAADKQLEKLDQAGADAAEQRRFPEPPQAPPQGGRQQPQRHEHRHIARQIDQQLLLAAIAPEAPDGIQREQVDALTGVPPAQRRFQRRPRRGPDQPGGQQRLGKKPCAIQRKDRHPQLPPPAGPFVPAQQKKRPHRQPDRQHQQHIAAHILQIGQNGGHFSSTIFRIPSAMACA